MQEFKEMIGQWIGKEVELKIQRNETDQPFEESYVDLGKVINQAINMEITIEDEEE